MIKIIKILLILILVVLFSCEEHGLIFSCPDCTAEEPLKTYLEIKLRASVFGYPTKIDVYEGNLEDSIKYVSLHTSNAGATILVSVNKKYTVTATYYIPGNYYIAVDAVTPKVKYDKEQCNDPCYFVYDRVVDLRLKHGK